MGLAGVFGGWDGIFGRQIETKNTVGKWDQWMESVDVIARWVGGWSRLMVLEDRVR